MTRLDPNMRLSRLVVTKDGERAYDEYFHAGVNIIRGEGNSVGKSTIADLIFFALGGDLSTWKDEAESCDLVYAEVVFNGSIVTLRREITTTSQQPLWIFFGDFDTADASSTGGWERYPYTRRGDRESFTQVLFRLMGMPEVPAEAEANITMHQLLRLMYVDQMTPVDRIFRFERNDSPLRRQAVGDLLCGVFDDRLYPAQLRLREREKEYETATQRYTALAKVLNSPGESFNIDFVQARRANLEAERKDILTKIEELKLHRFDHQAAPAMTEGIADALKSDLDRINGDLSDLQIHVGQIKYQIEDSKELISEIERTLSHLKQGETANSSLGPVTFIFCPSCFSPVAEPADENTCRLCHEHVEPDNDSSRFARMRNELEMQLKESQQLQQKRTEEYSQLRERAAKLTAIRDQVAAEYLRITRNFLTEADAEIDHLTSRAGYLERELIDLQRELRLAEQLDELSQIRRALNDEISALQENIGRWKDQRDQRQAAAYTIIQNGTADILSKDIQSEKEFSETSGVYFNFAEDRISVNGKFGFSASSLTVIRNAFHLALHWASCSDARFRYPRFLLMDNVEDKGMTQERSHNFQSIITHVSDSIKTDHQIIFTTSMIDPTLDASELTVGEKYSYSNKSLRIGRQPAA